MATVKVTALPASPREVAKHHWPTVNIVTTKTGNTPTYTQVTGVVGAGVKQVYDSGGTVKGLKTIHIPGYSAPG